MIGYLRPLLIIVLFASVSAARDEAKPERTRDVIYGRKHGLALTMDVFTPKKPNGFGVVAVVSGGWFSDTKSIIVAFYQELIDRGYTVFAVVHGSQPKFTLPEIIEDMHRAVRFVRHNAKKYKIDAERLGIMGASAGGHLSLMMGTSGTKGDPKASDAVDRESSTVQAVACFFPPTDFLNYGKKGIEMIDRQFQPPFTAAVDYQEFDRKKALYQRITDKDKLREISKQVSPISHLKKTSAPSLLISGDKDKLVPFQQSVCFVDRCKELGVPAKLETREGAGHGWVTILLDLPLFADWFDLHLRKIEKKADQDTDKRQSKKSR